MMAPAVISTDWPSAAAMPTNAMPKVPATVQELPIASAEMAHSRQQAA